MMGDLSDTIIDGDPFDINEGGEGGGGFDPTSLSLSTQTPVAADEIITGESGGTWVRKTLAKMKEYFSTIFTGATDLTDGTSGQVPQPLAGDQNKFLTGDAGWEDDTSKLITNFTSSDNASETGIITSSGGETSMTALTSGDTHGGLLGGLSKAVLNVRKLINTVKRIWQTVANAWVSGVSYSVGQVVTYTNGHTYICKKVHTSSSSITPLNTTYWDDKTIGDMIYSLNSKYASLFKIEEISTWANNNKLKTALFAIAIAQLTGTGSMTTVFMANKSSYNLSSSQYNGTNVSNGDYNGQYCLLYIIWNSSTGTLTTGTDTSIKKVWVITLNS